MVKSFGPHEQYASKSGIPAFLVSQFAFAKPKPLQKRFSLNLSLAMELSDKQTREILGYAIREAAVAETIIVGTLSRWDAEGRLTKVEGFTFVDFEDLTAELLKKLAPGLVLSPLFSESFDAIDVAQRLVEIGYTGRFRAIADDLPNVAVIRKDVIANVPDIDFDVLAMPRPKLESD